MLTAVEAVLMVPKIMTDRIGLVLWCLLSLLPLSYYNYVDDDNYHYDSNNTVVIVLGGYHYDHNAIVYAGASHETQGTLHEHPASWISVSCCCCFAVAAVVVVVSTIMMISIVTIFWWNKNH